MNGAEIASELLVASAALVAKVPAAQIKAGSLPEGVDLPAILITTISSVDRETVAAEETRRTTDRVQVTVHARTYREKRDVLRLVRAACADRFGDFAGMTDVSVHLDGLGPDLMDDASTIFAQAQDLLVSFNEAA